MKKRAQGWIKPLKVVVKSYQQVCQFKTTILEVHDFNLKEELFGP